MRINKVLVVIAAFVLVSAVFAAVVNAMTTAEAQTSKMTLDNVRDYAVAADEEKLSYAVDGGLLFSGMPLAWTQVDTPNDVIVSSVATDSANPDAVYIGAANEMAIYRSVDRGENWLRVPLTNDYIGGVTDIAVDSAQRLVYAGTDTAGLFRLRDVGPSVIVGAHLLLDAPVIEVVADSTGQGMAFARTEWQLLRAENYGLSWVVVENLLSTPTTLAIANTTPATIYVGTVDRGVLQSADGLTWQTANAGLGMVPGSRLYVDALTVDPAQPDVLYVATSYLLGSGEVHNAPVGVAMSIDNAASWSPIHTDNEVAVSELLPVANNTGAVYALTNQSRTPLALGNAPVVTAELVAAREASQATTAQTSILAWIIASLAAFALAYAVASDLWNPRSVETEVAGVPVHTS